MEWMVLQLADSAFPAGGFAHSAGLEAAAQLGEVDSDDELHRFVASALWQAGLGGLPLVREAHAAPAEVGALDALCHAFLISHVANRASRTQGRAFIATCAHSFPQRDGLARLDAAARLGEIHAHFAPVFGAALRALDVAAEPAAALYLHLALRGVLSAAVRLGRIGPHQAQALQHECAPLQDEVLAHCAALSRADLAQTAPLQDLIGALQDRLYSRMFQS